MSSNNVSRGGAETQRTQRNAVNDVTSIVIDASVTLHRDLGPGLLESVYEAILARKLMRRGLDVRRQVAVPLRYEGLEFKEAFRADIVVEDQVILELKTVERLHDAHKKQLLTYLKLSGMKAGLLLNFGSALMKNGIVRIVNDFDESP